MSVRVPEHDVPILATCDVLVCGGGAAGVTAAVAAARHGAEVILIERWPRVGGMATCALVNIWHRSDREKLVILGLAEESVQRADAGGWLTRYPSPEGRHETENFDPEGMTLVWHRMLDEAGVRVLCYTAAGEPILEGGRIRGVLCDTKRGRQAVVADIAIDATGDGDIAAKAGCPFEFGRPEDGRVQGMTMMYRLCGIDEKRLRAIPVEEREAIAAEMRALIEAGKLPPSKTANPCGYGNRGIPNMAAIAGDPLDEEELTRLTWRGRENVFRFLDWWRERVPGFEVAAIEQTGFSLGIRESRRVRGHKTLDAEMVLAARKQPDAIGHGEWMIDIHDPLGSGYTTWLGRDDTNMVPAGDSYHIPLGMCLNDTIPNLAVAGRCASSTHEGHSSVRVQSHCMVMGQGVGTLAALALDAGVELPEYDVRDLQRTLREDGVYLEDVPGD
jgi:hypothetical protein